MKHGEIVSFLWDIANLIRDTFRRGKYQDVILPLTVLRRLDCVLHDKKKAVLRTEAKYKDKLDNRDGQLRKASGFAFYNTSNFEFDSLLADHDNLAANLRKYIAGFSASTTPRWTSIPTTSKTTRWVRSSKNSFASSTKP